MTTAHGVDDPDRLLVARGRVVAQLDLGPVVDRPADHGQVRRLAEVDAQEAPVAEDGLELLECPGQGAVGIGAGDGHDGACRGGQGEALGRA